MTSVLASLSGLFGGSKSPKRSYDSNHSSFQDYAAGPSYLPSVPPRSRATSPFDAHSRSASFEEAGQGYSEVSFNRASSYPPQASHYASDPYPPDGASLQSPNLAYPPPTSPFASPASTSRAKLNGGPYVDDAASHGPAAPTSYPSLRQTFNRIRTVLDPLFPELLDTLGNPCLPQDMATLTDSFGRIYALPRDVRESMAVHDGQDIYSLAMSASYRERQARGLCWGLWLMSADEIADDYRHWRLLERKEARGEAPVDDPFAPRTGVSLPGMHSCPAGWVREEYSHPGWVPLLTDGLGNYIGVDLDPPATSAIPNGGPVSNTAASAWASLAGRPGQVIAFGREIDCKTVLFPGWGPDGGWARFLSSFADDLESNEFGTLGARSGVSGSPRDEGDDSYEDVGDGLGDIGYLDGGADLFESNFAENRSDSRGRRKRSSNEHDGQGGGWRLRGEYRDMSVIQALCARARQRWAEVGLYGSDHLGRAQSRRASMTSLQGLEPALSRRDSGTTVRPPSPNLMVVDPSKPAALSGPTPSTSTNSNLHLAEPAPASPHLTVSPPSPQRARFGAPTPLSASRRPPPPPPAQLFLPTMADLGGGEDYYPGEAGNGGTDDLEPITTASPRVSSERRNSRQQQADILPLAVAPGSRTTSPRPPTPSRQESIGLGIVDEVSATSSPSQRSPIEVIVQGVEAASLRPTLNERRSSTGASSTGSQEFVEASSVVEGS